MGPTEEPKNNEGGDDVLDASSVTALKNRRTLDGNYSLKIDDLIRDYALMRHDSNLRKKYHRSRDKHFEFGEPFFKQYEGTEYDHIGQNFQKNGNTNTLTQLVTPDYQVVSQGYPEDYFDKYHQYSLDHGNDKLYDKMTQYIYLYPHSTGNAFSEDPKFLDKFVRKNINKPARFLKNLYRTPKALVGTGLANRYAKKQGAPKHMLKYNSVENVLLNDESTLTSNYNGQNGIINLGVWGSDLMDVNIPKILAHEIGHTRKLYNTRDSEQDASGNGVNKREDSPYYHNNYDYINPKYIELLSPTVKVENEHDSELSEHYADLLALRMALRDTGINRGGRLYTNRDIKRFANTYEGSQDRYLQYHTDYKKVRKALNRVGKEGGKLDQNSNNERGTYTPFILDNQILKFDDNMGLMSYNIPMISRAKNNLEKPVEENNFFTEQPILTNQPEQLTVVIPEETKEEVSDEKTYAGQHVFKHSKMNLGHMDAFLAEAAKYGIFFRITSGVRHGAKTKQGKTSYHALGHAIDITPIQGETYADLKYKIKNSPGFVKGMQDRGYGIFDETTPEVMARTGASGAHGHIGKDRVAIRGLQQIMES